MTAKPKSPKKSKSAPQLKWDPLKKPAEIKTDRGTFEVKENNKRKGF